MTINPVALVGGATLGTSLSTLYTVPSSTKSVVKNAVFVNTDSASATLTVTVTRSGGSALTIIKAFAIASGTSFISRELSNLVLNSGDALNASAGTASVVNAFISGFTVT